MRLSQSPDILSLALEERGNNFDLLFYSDADTNADVSVSVMSSFNSEEDGIGNMKIMS